MPALLPLSLLALLAAPAVERPVVAVWNLEGKGVTLSSSELGRLTDRLTGLLIESGRYQTTPRAEVLRLLAAQKLESYQACFDESCQIELGKELAAQKSLSGSVERWGERCVVSLRLFDLAKATGEAAGSATGGCRASEVLRSLEDAVRRLTMRESPLAGARDAAPNERVAPVDESMISVPGGDFFMGCNEAKDELCSIDEKPGRIAFTETFQLDRTEVTVAAFEKCVQAGGCSASGVSVPLVDGERQEWIRGLCNWNQAGRDLHPINCVSWREADRYCRWRGKRLPTEVEWEKAARGVDRRRFPWGFEIGGDQPMANLADEAARRVWRSLKAIDGYDDGFSATAPVGSFAEGASPLGLLDMAGNVAEWTSNWYAEPKVRSVRGGSWRDLDRQARVSARASASPEGRDPAIGFRCAGA